MKGQSVKEEEKWRHYWQWWRHLWWCHQWCSMMSLCWWRHSHVKAWIVVELETGGEHRCPINGHIWTIMGVFPMTSWWRHNNVIMIIRCYVMTSRWVILLRNDRILELLNSEQMNLVTHKVNSQVGFGLFGSVPIKGWSIFRVWPILDSTHVGRSISGLVQWWVGPNWVLGLD